MQASADVQPVPTVIPRRPALHGAADFVSWTWEMVNAGYDDIGWSTDGSRISIKKPERLASLILPQFFRHSQYASWVRALNAYHFKKVATGQWQHPCFHRDRPELLKRIVRKPREAAASRVTAPSCGGGGGGGGGHSSSSMALDLRVVGSQVGAVLAEERSRLCWLKQEMRRLEAEVQEAEREDLRQRWEAVGITQYMANVMELPLPLPLPIPLPLPLTPTLTRYIFEQMKLHPRDAHQEPRLAGGLLAGGLLAGGTVQERLLAGGGSMQERGGGPAITMLSSATAISREVSSATAMMEDGGGNRRGGGGNMMEEGLSSATAMLEDGGRMLEDGVLVAKFAMDMAASDHSEAASDHGGAASWGGGGTAWGGCGGAPACAEPHPHPPGPSRISSRDLAQLDLAEIDLLSQV